MNMISNRDTLGVLWLLKYRVSGGTVLILFCFFLSRTIHFDIFTNQRCSCGRTGEKAEERDMDEVLKWIGGLGTLFVSGLVKYKQYP